jgi:hypothetical protein
VGEQQWRNYGSVTFRCLPCRRRRGDAPALAVLEGGGGRSRYRLYRYDRLWASYTRLRVLALDPSLDRGLEKGSPWRGGTPRGRGKGMELACRRCPHRPGLKLRTLYALAEDAIGEGRRDVFV